MSNIRKPKPVSELLDDIEPEQLMSVLGKYGVTNSKGEYLHWNKFKWRVDKEDDEKAAWVATKLARTAVAKQIPMLKAEDGHIFHYCVPESLFAKLHHIDKETGGGHAIGDGPFVTTQEKDKYLVQNLMMEEAITSSQLEGASTTRKVAKEMLKTNRQPSDTSEQMIFNNFLLMKKALEKKDEDLSIDLILDLHLIATHQAIENDAVSGALRSDNSITISDMYNEVAHEPPCHTTLIDRLNALCEFANQCNDWKDANHFIHPLIKAIILHFMIGYIHPFGDGNGRTARALFYWFMLKSGYWLFEYVSISKLIKEKRSDYDNAYVYTETDAFDLTYFIYHQVDVVAKAVDALQAHIKSKRSEFYQFREWIEKSPVSKKLKRNQLQILQDALKQPGKAFTSKQVALEFDVTENTARAYLDKLVDEDLLIPTKKKKSKTILYIAPAGLVDKLRL